MVVSIPKLKNFIDGAFHAVESVDIPLVDPSDGRLLGHQAVSSPVALEEALEAAARCHRQRTWYDMGVRRADYLLKLAERLEPELEALATLESMNTGINIQTTRRLIGLLPLILRAAALQVQRHPDRSLRGSGESVELWYKPWGPALCLCPWNSPAPLGLHKVASALAAGAPVLWKPSEWTPYSSQRLMELMAELDFPAGAVQLIHGAAREGAFMASDARVRAISFTGGVSGGQALARLSATELKRLQLELGGHNPFIVLPDAAMQEALDGLMLGLTTMNGQWCRAVGRVFVPSARKAELIEGFMQRVRTLRIGPALDPGHDMGPLIHSQHKSRLEQRLLEMQSQGARVLTADRAQDEPGSYLLPRLVAELPPELDREEMFGPIATLHSYDDHTELLGKVQDSPYGLAAYIFGQDEDTLYKLGRQLDVGSVKFNAVTLTSLDPEAPRSAWGLSGLGDEGGFESFRFFQGSSLLGQLKKS